ncbi:hypothetical protein COCON_G00101000 [Conger conger]|uniref:Uncharacterized protein n=1 Tax=Conger conger TaxID=82655 RepID=A0A9Q1HXD5_CONCO|nr:hypothetical protein COCON_G00101000 [Conger conger]
MLARLLLRPLLLAAVSSSYMTPDPAPLPSSPSSSSEPPSSSSSSSSSSPSPSSLLPLPLLLLPLPPSPSSPSSSLCPCVPSTPQCPACTTHSPPPTTTWEACPVKELAAYKAVTGLLSVTVLIMVLIRFGPQIYTTACKRLFGRRRREWIGPTESVSFRAQNTLYPNSNDDKRLSFPGLERLAVNSSREPSSNRNSDYDSYN